MPVVSSIIFNNASKLAMNPTRNPKWVKYGEHLYGVSRPHQTMLTIVTYWHTDKFCEEPYWWWSWTSWTAVIGRIFGTTWCGIPQVLLNYNSYRYWDTGWESHMYLFYCVLMTFKKPTIIVPVANLITNHNHNQATTNRVITVITNVILSNFYQPLAL